MSVIHKNQYAMLDGSQIIVRNWSNNTEEVKRGYLKEGKFSFSVPKDIVGDFYFEAEINARHKTKSNAEFEVIYEEYEENVVSSTFYSIDPHSIAKESENEWSIEFSIKENQQIDGVWSVFQAVKCVYDSIYADLEYVPQKKLSVITCASLTGFNPMGDNYGLIRLALEDHRAWHIIAHEFSHFIADDTDSVIGSPGLTHNKEINQYDNKDNSKTLYKKEPAIAHAFAEGFASWFGKNLLNLSKYNTQKYALEGAETAGGIYGIGGSRYEKYDLNVSNENGAVYGEDAELAIARLLWNITNKKMVNS